MLNYLDVFLFVWNGPGSEKVFYNAPAGFLFYVLSAFRFTVSCFVSLFPVMFATVGWIVLLDTRI